jgi:NAD(P)-dependent dehydrogenase (short-subunit alcohol dehydrogenase family)
MGVCVVTGANRGIGLELVRKLHAGGRNVVAVCRKPSRELAELGVRIETGIDLSNPESVATLGQRLAGDEIDLLINNAGVLLPDQLDSVSAESIKKQFEVNSIGPVLVTQALAPRLCDGAKVAIITSRMGSIADNSSGAMYGYRMSKAAVNAAGVSMAHDLKARGVAVVILHPGFVKTEMTASRGTLEPAESAAGLLARIDETNLDNSGRFVHMNGEALPW